MIWWQFRDYVRPSGKNQVRKWSKDLSEKELAKLDSVLRNLARQQQWTEPHFKHLSGAQSGMSEIRWNGNQNRQLRLIGCKGPDPGQYTLLLGCSHKGNRYTPTSALDTATSDIEIFSIELESPVTTKATLIKKLRKSKNYRKAFVDAEISIGIPFQIRALREQRGWSQNDLAKAASFKQPRICSMEQAGYGAFTLSTLKALAAAFDVGLVVRFAPFGEMVEWADTFSADTFGVPSAETDPQLASTYEARADTNSATSAMHAATSQPGAGLLSALLRDARISRDASTTPRAALSAGLATSNTDRHMKAA